MTIPISQTEPPFYWYMSAESAIRGPRRGPEHWNTKSVALSGWLYERAQAGDLFAKARLGLYLSSGETDKSRVDEGLMLLSQAADQGSIFAKEALSGLLMDDEAPWCDLNKGRDLLDEAARAGSLTALSELAHRHMCGAGYNKDLELGLKTFARAAKKGDRFGMAVVARHLLQESGEDECGLEWMRCAGASKPIALSRVGSYIYARGRASYTRPQRRRITEEAARFFSFGLTFRPTDPFCTLYLAYLVRRREIMADKDSFHLLIDGLLSNGSPLAIVNEALRLAEGGDSAPDWFAADLLMAGLQAGTGVLEWWKISAEEGEPEGHLVIAWLMRWSLTSTLDNLSLGERLALAKIGFPDLPQWLLLPGSHEASNERQS